MPRRSLTPAVVVAEAAVLADADGLDAVTVSAVARRLAVQPASLYSHLPGRDALLDGLTELALGELAERVADEIAGRSGRPALAALADAHRGYARAHPGRWAALQRRAGPGPVASPAAARLVALNRAVLRGYPVPEDEHVHAVRLVGSTVNGYLTLTGAGGFDHRGPSPDVSWPRVLDALDVALRHWPTDPPPEETR